MKKFLLAFIFSATGLCSSLAHSQIAGDYISIEMLVDNPRTGLPDLFYLDKTKNDPVAFEIYNRHDRPISCTNLYVDIFVAPKGNCGDGTKVRKMPLRFQNVNLWKIKREPNEKDPWGLNFIYDVYEHWKPYQPNDLALNAVFYNFDVQHPYYHQRFSGEEELAALATKMGLTPDDVEFCRTPDPAINTAACYFGCMNDRNLKEIGNQTCYKAPSTGL